MKIPSLKTIMPLVILLSVSLSLQGQTKQKSVTISGFIADEISKEFLIGATIYDVKSGKGTSSNEYGFYSLSIPPGPCELIYSYLGYNPEKKSFALTKDTSITIYFNSAKMIEEVVVSAKADGVSRHLENSMSVNKIALEDMDKLPILLGEPDVFQLITLKPGVSSGNEGGGINVRGGSADQNLILLDDVPIYNANHLFGFVSVFNGDAMKSAKIYKGGFPARYGGRLSSIIDVRMKEGNMSTLHGNINVGVLSGKFNLEGPIKKDKTSFMISGRRTLLDLITSPLLKNQPEYWVYNFYDLNAKINHRFSEKSRLYISSFYGNDKLAARLKEEDSDGNLGETRIYKEENKIVFGNRTLAARWNYQWAPKLFSNTILMFSKYSYKYTGRFNPNTNEKDPAKKMEQSILSESNIEDVGTKLDFSYVPNSSNYIRFGLSYVNHNFTPTTNTETFNQEKTVLGDNNVHAHEYTAYLEDDIKIGKMIRVNPGVHFSSFQVQDSKYDAFQPRLSVSVNPITGLSFKASYSKMTQYIHLLVSSGLGLPTDLWVPSTDNVLPETSNQYAIGFTKSFDGGFELTTEAYYKDLKNVVEYKAGQNIFASSDNWEEKVDAGKGKSYGFEFLLEKTIGKTTGWLGYTYSKTTRTFEKINNGTSFPFKYDRTHDVNLVVTHKLNEKIDFGLIWVYGTGNAYSFATTNFYAPDGDIVKSAERNNHRMAPYHRLDLSVNFHKKRKQGKRTWSLGLYNAYNRKNPFYITQRVSAFSGKASLRQTSLLPIIPFVSYKRSF